MNAVDYWPWWNLSPAANSPRIGQTFCPIRARILGFTKGKFADWRGLDKPKTSWTTLTPRTRDSVHQGQFFPPSLMLKLRRLQGLALLFWERPWAQGCSSLKKLYSLARLSEGTHHLTGTYAPVLWGSEGADDLVNPNRVVAGLQIIISSPRLPQHEHTMCLDPACDERQLRQVSGFS